MNSTTHKTVLLQETIDGLNIQKGDVVVDGTLGGGGHSEEIARRGGKDITLIGIDMDDKALERARERIGKITPHAHFFKDNFRNIDKVLRKMGVDHADRILLDIGLSSDQFEVSGRGFTFKKDEPLLMTFSDDPTTHPFTAWTIVNEWAEESIADIIYGYGEEQFSRRIAKMIVEERAKRSIDTTFELSHIIESAVPFWYRKGKINPSTKTFQALRIAVNDELGALKEGIRVGFEMLAPKGRLAVISFHSLEDRIVKHFFRELKDEEKAILVNKKAIVPDIEEIRSNPRARSAKLRIIEKLS
jgi:16S rRNA (cytosine1402-N4)-methyltransferase